MPAKKAAPGKRKAPRPRARAATEFEATCPACGQDFGVEGNAREASCPSCGAAIRLSDEAAPAQPAQAPLANLPATDAPTNSPGAALVVGFLAPIVVAILFFVGHAAMDRKEPDIVTAGTWYFATVLAAAATVYSLWLFLPVRATRLAPYGLLSALPMGWLAAAVGMTYASSAFVFVFLWVYAGPVLLLYLIVMAVMAGLAASRGRAASAVPGVLVGGAGMAAGIGAVAAFMLTDLQHQADLSRQAHNAGAPMAALVALLLLFLAARRR